MDDKIMIFKKKLPILIICQKFNVKYQTPPKKELPKSKSW